MVKIVEKKKRFRIEGIISIIFVVSLLGYVASFTLLRAHNVVLMQNVSNNEMDTKALKIDVANLELEIKQLDYRERIIEIAKQHQLKESPESYVSVK